MPKGTLSFKLPEEQAEFEQACQAGSLQSIISELDTYLRAQVKYNNELSEDARVAVQAARARLWELVNASNLGGFFS